jgi:diacylglycerol O-acyltransferase / wax synthase
MAKTNGTARATWGASADMTPWEGVMWRAEVDPATRSTGMLIEILDCEPDWDRLVAAHERVTRAIPRLRDRVVEPIVPLVPPAFSRDEHFDVRNHLQRIRLGSGTMRELLDLAESVYDRPFQSGRPPWEGLLVQGLEGGGAAYVLKIHHSLTDGQGLVQLLSMAHSRTRKPTPQEMEPPLPPSEQLNSLTLLTSRLMREATATPGRAFNLWGESIRLAGRTMTRPTAVIGDGLRYTRSLMRVLSPPPTERSPLLVGNSGSQCRFVTLEVPLDDLKAAGKAAGGSVNDAFLAALLGAFRRYHEHHGVNIDVMPMALPISLRTADDPAGGNRFAGARFAAPVGEPDPRQRIQAIREFVVSARAEPAIGVLELLAPAVSRLPTFMVVGLTASMTSMSDVQASNVPGLGHTAYLSGAKITHTFPFGPRPGVAAMVVMLSYDGTCCIGVNFDPEAIADTDVFERCLREGCDEVLALRNS